MNKLKYILSVLIMLSVLQLNASAAFWSKDDNKKLGNEIQKEEYPESRDVEPRIDAESGNLVIQGGVEEVIDITLEECLRCALGNNPRIQAALQDSRRLLRPCT